MAFYAVPYMSVCVVCNALCNHLHSHTKNSHSNSDALPILPTPPNLSGLCCFYLIPWFSINYFLQLNSKFSDFKLVFSTRIHFGLRTNLIILPYLAKPRIK